MSSIQPQTCSRNPEPTAFTDGGTTWAHGGENLTELAARIGVDAHAIRQANPDLPNPEHLLAGQPVALPDHSFSSAAAGVAGAMGRETTVHGLMERAYQAGRAAPQEAFSGAVLRSVGEQAHEATAYDHRYGNPGRYNSASERLIYTSPDTHSATLEAAAYAKPNEAAMANRSLIAGEFTAAPDAQGRGGVANLRLGLQQVGLPTSALTAPKGGNAPSALYQLAGEHPYSLGQQAAKGAADAGASALRGPSATGSADQINIIARNTQPHQLHPTRLVRFDPDGIPGGAKPASSVKPMPANDKPIVEGPLDKAAGRRNGPSTAHQTAPDESGSRLRNALQLASGAPEGYPRANSGRYGAAGGAVMSLGQDALAAVRGGPVDLTQSATNAASNATLGYGGARVADKLTPRIGLRGAGGAVAGAIEGVMSTSTNAQAYRKGEVSAARASANIAVDTGTAVGAGVAGAAVGAFIGSVVPVAGTAVGAVAGFAAGTIAYAAVKYVGQATGAIDAAKTKLAQALSGAEQPLGRALNRIGEGLDSTSRIAGQAWSSVKFW